MTPRHPTTRSDPTHDALAHTHPPIVSLHAGDGSGRVATSTLALPVDLHAFGAEGDAPRPVRLEVIPPPGPDGVLPSADGRAQRVRDAAHLAGALNAQAVAARVDRDHRSEPTAKTFSGSTEAEGWLSGFRLNARGGIDADADLDAGLVAALRARRYRYVSPALLLDDHDEVVGLSSVAFVNNPNLPIQAPTVNASTPMDKDELKTKEADLAAREAKIAAREAATAKLLENAATAAVDAAVNAGQILPAQKDYHLNAIKTHSDGIEKGIEAFNAFAGAGTGAPGSAADLTRRTGPTGTPPSGSAARGGRAFPVPAGWQGPGEERLALHARIADHAVKRGISYRKAVVELGATG